MSVRNGQDLLCALCVLFAGAASAEDDFNCTEKACSSASFLQTGLESIRTQGSRDLVLMHIPYNFGHTLEFVGLYPTSTLDDMAHPEGSSGGSGPGGMKIMSWAELNMTRKPGGEVWGHLNPDLSVVSSRTGCPMYYTPPKYWPSDLAERYFGNKQVFGLFRNPYERLVSFFRGNYDDYGGSYGKLHDTCDVNTAVKQMMQTYLSGDRFSNNCTFLPQTEYIDMPHGITVPIDLQKFPKSMNDVLLEHGYDNMYIRTKDIQHVASCDNVWAGDLDAETRALVKKVYKRDFEFLCSTFGYCDHDAPVCLQGVPRMCPDKEFAWDDAQQKYQRRTLQND